MATSKSRTHIPTAPFASNFSPEVYTAFENLIATPEIFGIGANVHDIEILRLACLEKIRRDGPESRGEDGFKLRFLAHISADWAEEVVQFWDEGLGFGWNLLVTDDGPHSLLTQTLFYGARPYVFALFTIPSRLPGSDCNIHKGYTICRRNTQAPTLTANEKEIWEKVAKEHNGGYDVEEPNIVVWND